MVGPALLRFYKNLGELKFRSSYEDALYRELQGLVNLNEAVASLPTGQDFYFGVWRDYGSEPDRKRYRNQHPA